jgi:hypothetical protein
MLAAQAAGEAPADRLRLMALEFVRFGLEESDAYRVAFMQERGNLPAEHQAAVHHTGMRGFSVLQAFFQQERGSDDAWTAAIAQSVWARAYMAWFRCCCPGRISLGPIAMN